MSQLLRISFVGPHPRGVGRVPTAEFLIKAFWGNKKKKRLAKEVGKGKGKGKRKGGGGEK